VFQPKGRRGLELNNVKSKSERERRKKESGGGRRERTSLSIHVFIEQRRAKLFAWPRHTQEKS